MSALLVLHSVDKSYVTNEHAASVLANVHFAVERGESVAIVGFSGAGKTTLLSILAGLVKPDRGGVTFRDRPITGPGPERGVVFQNYSLLPWLTVYENVLLAVRAAFKSWPAERQRKQAEHFIEVVNLTPARDKRPPQLSGGMRQRVALARALAMDPEVLLLDEPLGALDALTRATLQIEIERLSRESEKTVVLVTNDVDEALLICDRVVPLSKGPSATLGPSFVVECARPREKREFLRDPQIKRMRFAIMEWLVESGRRDHPRIRTSDGREAVAKAAEALS